MDAARIVVGSGPVEIECLCRGTGDMVLLLPGLGGDARQFDVLAVTLARAGFRAVAVNARGIGASRGPLEGLTLHDYAADAGMVIERLDGAPADVVGRAFGNRVARCLAADRPDLVRSLILISAGGSLSTVPGVHAAAGEPVHQLNEPTGLSAAAAAQRAATRATSVSDWWTAGSAPMLVLQGLEDRIAPPENGRKLRQELGARVRLTEVEGAGHDLLRERPELVTAHVLEYLSVRS